MKTNTHAQARVHAGVLKSNVRQALIWLVADLNPTETGHPGPEGTRTPARRRVRVAPSLQRVPLMLRASVSRASDSSNVAANSTPKVGPFNAGTEQVLPGRSNGRWRP